MSVIVLAFETGKDKLELIVVEIDKDRTGNKQDDEKSKSYLFSVPEEQSHPLSLGFGRLWHAEEWGTFKEETREGSRCA